MFDMTAEVIRSGEAFPTDGADVRLVYATVVRTNVVRHAVFSLEALLTDGALKRLLV